MQGGFRSQHSVAENARLSGPLLSRFDIVLALRDTPDTGWDAEAADHILHSDQREVCARSSLQLAAERSERAQRAGGGLACADASEVPGVDAHRAQPRRQP